MQPETLAHLAWSTVHGLSNLLVEGALENKSRREINAEAKHVVEGLTRMVAATR
jgi:hypothetical protein